jgi:modulator of FtsH protease HflK
MGWNDSNDKKDPWSGKNAPPDLDAALQSFIKKIKQRLQGSGPSRISPNLLPSNPDKMWFIMAFIIILVLWILSGIFIVDPAEQAVIMRFGRYTNTVGPGPHWIPRFISSKKTYNVERVSDYSYSAQMLTKDENLVSVSLAVQYRIKDLKAYLFNVTDPEESLQQATSSALRQVVGTTTLDQIITEGREAWGASVEDNLKAILKQYKTGIQIVNVSPQPARAPENVQDAFDDAIKAQEDEKRFKEQAFAYEASVVPIAEGNAKRLVQEAEAYSKQLVLQAKGEVAEFLALLPEYNRSPQVTSERMYLETYQHVLSRSTKIIINSKAGNVVYLPLDKLNASLTDLTASNPQSITPETSIVPPPPTEQTNVARPSTRSTLRSTNREE